jgi:hypothetical protein
MDFAGSVLLNMSDVLITTSTQNYPLGTRGYTRDGRAFRYAKNAATALAAGRLCQSSVPVTYANSSKMSGTTKILANKQSIKLVSCSGAFSTINAYAEGYVYSYCSSTGLGQPSYAQIKSHNRGNASATNVITFQFAEADTLYAASTILGATDLNIGVIKNPYKDVIVTPSGAKTSMVVGVPVRPITASYFFWLQTWGICPVRSYSRIGVIGGAVGASTSTNAGTVSGCSASTAGAKTCELWGEGINLVGDSAIVGVSGETRPVYLRLAP